MLGQINDHEMGDTEIEKTLQAILYDVPVPGLLQAERYIVYRMLAYMLLNYNSGELEESVFEVCACYFPVDFNPFNNGNSGTLDILRQAGIDPGYGTSKGCLRKDRTRLKNAKRQSTADEKQG
ncbi:hypothetical protein HPB52_003319 [Rhipicephalus sanguineus]|uniref:Uncharacterized protein n=1 Tax=Rhipicephalus sanguineus TaxID=34632 RepID=A0A9D4T6Q5_RHISA|nr:hypothetical protein HPB52_003319 [Rhipicephalus sanguineus]